jgi:hypothetical protein
MLQATGRLRTWARWTAIGISALLPLSGAELQPVCSLEKPSALPGETIWARAQLPNAGPSIRYEWTAATGKVLRSGSSVLWNLSGVQPGLYELSAKLVTSAGYQACAAKLLVLEPANERGELGGALLLPKQREGTGKYTYGAYTYVLLPGPPPDTSSRERYLAVLAAWQKLVPAIGKLENYYKKTQLNVTFVPVTTTNKPQETGEWLLSSYDYVRAALILHKFPAELQRGPYLVTSTVPLTYGAPINRETLVQNLSGVPATMAGYWVESFLRQAAHDRFWLAPARVSFALRMRTLLETTGESIGPVAIAFSEFSKYFGWK